LFSLISNGKILFMRFFFWILGVIILAGWEAGRFLHPGKADLPSNIFLIKYALDISVINICFVLFKRI